ncbi:MAG: hypothetical protein ACF8LK_01495 [Phycisphaerales bacterium JB041]
MTLRITHLFAALLAAFTLSAAPALAQADPGEIVRNAAAAMAASADRASNAIQHSTRDGIAVINRLDDNGASDRELVAAARRATGAVNHAARHGTRHIGLIAERAAQALRALEADRSFFAALAQARRSSSEQVGQSRERGTNAIQAALRAALDD